MMRKGIMKLLPSLMTAAVTLAVNPPVAAAQKAAAPGAEGVAFGDVEKFEYVLRYPDFQVDGKRNLPIVECNENGEIRIRYGIDGAPRVTVGAGEGESNVVVRVTPGTQAGELVWETYLPISIAGGRYEFFTAETCVVAGTFPKTQPESPYLVRDQDAVSVNLSSPGAGTVQLNWNRPVRWQLQDNRAWNWKIFALLATHPVIPGSGEETLTIDWRSVPSSELLQARIDRFGQVISAEFPNKVVDENELRGDVERERQWLATLPRGPELDRFGGLAGSGKKFGLKGSGFFRLAEVEGRDVLVTPEGNVFFALGLCAFVPCDDYTLVRGRESIYEWLPETAGEFATAWRPESGGKDFSFYLANWIRKHGKPWELREWKLEKIDFVRQCGFNSQGGFGEGEFNAERDFPYTPILPLDSWRLPPVAGGCFDPFDPEVRAKVDAIFSELVAPRANDPLIIGYFSGNEQLYNELPRELPALPAEAAAKKALAKFLRERYETVTSFNQAWESDLTSLEELETTVLLPKNEQSWQDLQTFSEIFLNAYFDLINDAFRRHAPNHLYLGARFLNSMRLYEPAVRACGRVADCFSLNYYSRDIVPQELEELHGLCGRPLLLSEWSFGTAEEGLAGGCIDVADQAERGRAYRNYVEQAAALPYVIGSQWFSLLDQAPTGRWFQGFQGESMNIGLFNVADRPFRPFLEEAAAAHRSVYDVMFKQTAPFRWDRASRRSAGGRTIQIARMTGAGHRVDGAFRDYPARPALTLGAEELVEGEDDPRVRVNFFPGWDEKYLYCFVRVQDPTPGRNPFPTDQLWRGDCVEFFLGAEKVDAGGPLLFSDRQLLLRAAEEKGFHWENSTEQHPVEYIVRADSQDGYLIEVAIPWSALGIEKAESGMELRFDLALDDGAGEYKRLRQYIFSGGATNSAERGNWARAVLVN